MAACCSGVRGSLRKRFRRKSEGESEPTRKVAHLSISRGSNREVLCAAVRDAASIDDVFCPSGPCSTSPRPLDRQHGVADCRGDARKDSHD